MTLPRRFTVLSMALFGTLVLNGALFVATAIAADHDVDIELLTFQPQEITIAPGDTVTWTVTNAVPEGHTVTSGAPDADSGTVFDSPVGLNENGQTFEFKFEDAGTYPYYCKIHGAVMSGTITVAEATESAPAASEPAASEPAQSEAPASEAPASAAPASEAPASGAPESEAPGTEVPGEEAEPIDPERKVLAAGILAVAIVVMFAGAAIWRRMNPA